MWVHRDSRTTHQKLDKYNNKNNLKKKTLLTIRIPNHRFPSTYRLQLIFPVSHVTRQISELITKVSLVETWHRSSYSPTTQPNNTKIGFWSTVNDKFQEDNPTVPLVSLSLLFFF